MANRYLAALGGKESLAFVPSESYMMSKTLSMALMRHMAARYESAFPNLRILMVDPGLVRSGILRRWPKLLDIGNDLLLGLVMGVQMSAATSCPAMLSFLDDRHLERGRAPCLFSLRGYPVVEEVSSLLEDQQLLRDSFEVCVRAIMRAEV